jgi:hypothetical protein
MPNQIERETTVQDIPSTATVEQAPRRLIPARVHFGIEFEFAAPTYSQIQTALSRAGIHLDPDDDEEEVRYWTLGEDCSVLDTTRRNMAEDYRRENRVTHNWDSCELRTPMMDPDNSEHLAEVKRALDACKAAGGQATRSCGMHIHISCHAHGRDVDCRAFSDKIEEAFRRFVLRNRERYCQPGFSEWDKYYGVRRVDGNHLEVRIFNGTMDADKALRRLRKVVRMYRRSLAPLRQRDRSQRRQAVA